MKKYDIKKLWETQFWPVNLMKDCSHGTSFDKYLAYQYNRAKAYILQIPILNWMMTLITSYGGLVVAEWLSHKVYPGAIYFAAFCGIIVAMSFIPCLILCISYVFLKNVDKTL